MKIVLRLDAASNGFVIAEGPEGVAIKSRCENSMSPNLILVDVPEKLVERETEFVEALKQHIDELETNGVEMMNDIGANSDALTNLSEQFAALKEERDTLSNLLKERELELDEVKDLVEEIKTQMAALEAKYGNAVEASDESKIITTQFEEKTEDKG